MLSLVHRLAYQARFYNLAVSAAICAVNAIVSAAICAVNCIVSAAIGAVNSTRLAFQARVKVKVDSNPGHA